MINYIRHRVIVIDLASRYAAHELDTTVSLDFLNIIYV